MITKLLLFVGDVDHIFSGRPIMCVGALSGAPAVRQEESGGGNTRRELAVTLLEAFAEETRRGAGLAILAWVLWFFVGTVGITLLSQYLASHYHAHYRLPPDAIVIGTVASLASLPIYFVAVRARHPLSWCFLALAVEILGIAQNKFFWFWQPPAFAHLPVFLAVRSGEIQTFLILLAIYVLPLSRRFIAWSCAAVVAAWTAGIVNAFLSYPGATLYWGPFGPGIGDSGFRTITDIGVLVVDDFVIQIVLLVAFCGFLAVSVGQGRRFVIDRVGAYRDAAFLRRFFPSGVAARLEHGTGEALAPAHRHIAILFAVSGASQSLEQAERRFDRIEACVFAQGGTMDRFSGGPIMASFGALEDDPSAAGKALACAREIARDTSAAIALHAGIALCGDVGGTHGRAFSVVGDVVNTARRLLDTATDRGGGVLVSGAFLAALPASRDGGSFEDLGYIALRGRNSPVQVGRLV